MWGQNATLEATEEDINDKIGQKDRDSYLKKKICLHLLHLDSIFSTRPPSHAHLNLLLLSFPVSSSAKKTQKSVRSSSYRLVCKTTYSLLSSFEEEEEA